MCQDNLPSGMLHTVTSQGTNSAHQPVCQQPWERDNHREQPQRPSSCGQLMLQGRQCQQLHSSMQGVNFALTDRIAFLTPRQAGTDLELSRCSTSVYCLLKKMPNVG